MRREIFLLLWSLEMLVKEEQGYKRLQVHPPPTWEGGGAHRGRVCSCGRSPQPRHLGPWSYGTYSRYFCRSTDSSHSNCDGPYNLSPHSVVVHGQQFQVLCPLEGPAGELPHLVDRLIIASCRKGLPCSAVKNLPAMQEAWVQSLGWEDCLAEGMATHSSILA